MLSASRNYSDRLDGFDDDIPGSDSDSFPTRLRPATVSAGRRYPQAIHGGPPNAQFSTHFSPVDGREGTWYAVRMDFESALQLFVVHCKAERLYAKETQAKIRDVFKTWIQPHLGHLAPAAIQLRDVTNMRAAM